MIKNITKVVDYANGKYSWILSDDDCLFENTIYDILKLLENSKTSIFVLNYTSFNNELNKIIVDNVMNLSTDLNLLDKYKFINNIVKNWYQLS
jgi:hypothetical protein